MQVLRHALKDPQQLLNAVGDIVGYAQQHSVGPSLETAAKSMGFGYAKARQLPFPLSFYSISVCTWHQVVFMFICQLSDRQLTKGAICPTSARLTLLICYDSLLTMLIV